METIFWSINSERGTSKKNRGATCTSASTTLPHPGRVSIARVGSHPHERIARTSTMFSVKQNFRVSLKSTDTEKLSGRGPARSNTWTELKPRSCQPVSLSQRERATYAVVPAPQPFVPYTECSLMLITPSSTLLPEFNPRHSSCS